MSYFNKFNDCLNKVNKIREDIFKRRSGSQDKVSDNNYGFNNIKNVIIICSAPRSGSSALFSLLKQHPMVYSLHGESTPYFKLNGLVRIGDLSDELPKDRIDGVDKNRFFRDIINDLSCSIIHKNIKDVNRIKDDYVDDLIMRFFLQWPTLEYDHGKLFEIIHGVLTEYIDKNKDFDLIDFYLELIKKLKNRNFNINPYYYDIPVDRIKKAFPESGMQNEPPSDGLFFEEPPFILMSPTEKILPADLNRKVLLLKTTVNAYRMELLEEIFKEAVFKIILLKRNPAASINGLYDGWLYRGFFSHNLNVRSDNNYNELNITGYSDKYEWGKRWWNFDLPFGWEAYSNNSLEEVCGFQWYSANSALQKYISNRSFDSIEVSYEDIFMNGEQSTITILNKLYGFIDLNKNKSIKIKRAELPLVQSTFDPKPFRWKEKEELITAVLNRRELRELSAEIGYDPADQEKWV